MNYLETWFWASGGLLVTSGVPVSSLILSLRGQRTSSVWFQSRWICWTCFVSQDTGHLGMCLLWTPERCVCSAIAGWSVLQMLIRSCWLILHPCWFSASCSIKDTQDSRLNQIFPFVLLDFLFSSYFLVYWYHHRDSASCLCQLFVAFLFWLFCGMGFYLFM